MQTFLEALREQRWDDHRYYHHSRVNQALHFFSANCFLVTYGMLFTRYTSMAILFGWTIAMVSRQVGHFFFEPKGFDQENQATHEHKEAIKVGFNLQRKVILHLVWGMSPVVLWFVPSFFGLFAAPHTDFAQYLEHTATLWLWIAGGALVGRTLQLFFTRGFVTGVAWFCKILTDPFNDWVQYKGSVPALLRGERMDPMIEGAPQKAQTA